MKRDSMTDDQNLNESVYQKLKSIANQLMLNERKGHTLSATDLVHEAYLKISESDMERSNEGVYFFVLARQMRRVLVDYGRRKSSVRHGGGFDQVNFTEGLDVAGQNILDFSAISDAIDELSTVSERSAKIIELYYFVGITRQRVADLMNVSMSTFAREVHFAKAYIGDYLNQQLSNN